MGKTKDPETHRPTAAITTDIEEAVRERERLHKAADEAENASDDAAEAARAASARVKALKRELDRAIVAEG